MPVHTVDEALSEFKLIAGAGSESSKEACAVTLLAWMAGSEWTDHPECAHRLICDLTIRANDNGNTTDEQKAELVKTGVTGLLDTWWVPPEVVVWSLRGEREEDMSQFDVAMRMLRRIAEWKGSKERPDLRGVNLRGARLGGADLRGANLRSADLRDAHLGGAEGDAYTELPAGWKLNESALVVQNAKEEE